MIIECPLCYGIDITRLFETRDRIHGVSGLFTIHRCNGCYAIFIQPWLSNQELSAYYAAGYAGQLRQIVMENKQARTLELDVREGELTDDKFSDSFFDVIRINHALEHLDNPQRTFLEIHRILKPEGVVHITTPNTRSFNFWLFNENWYGLEAPRHRINYCPKALKYLCRATGFEVVNISFRSGAYGFLRSVKYFLDENGKHWPAWMRRFDWPRSKPILLILKPFFLLADLCRIGDVMVPTLQKSSQSIETGKPLPPQGL